jgi:hypothetical protein
MLAHSVLFEFRDNVEWLGFKLGLNLSKFAKVRK